MGGRIVVRKNVKKKTKAKDTQQPSKSEQVVVPAITEIPGFPRDEGPPPIPNGRGRDAYRGKLTTNPLITADGKVEILIDPGALLWLWETTESQALNHYRRYRSVVPDAVDAATRALTEIRKAGHVAYPLSKQRKIRVVRKKEPGTRIVRKKK